MNLDGVIEKTLGDRVFKMSNNVNKIQLIAPFVKESNVLINFKLPDGSMQYGVMVYSGLSITDDYNLWEYKVKDNVTQIPGKVEVNIEVRTKNEVLTTAKTHITVEDTLSSEIEPTDVDEILEYARDALNKAHAAYYYSDAKANEVKRLIDEYIKDGDTNLEVLEAREGFNKLSDRIRNTANNKFLNITGKDIDRPIISFIDDDGHQDVFTRLLPIFQSHGVRAGCAIITGFLGDPSYMTVEQMIECADYGFEMLSHGHTISGNLIDDCPTDEDLRYQLQASKEFLVNYGVPCTGIVYPQNRHNLNVRNMSSFYFNYGFGNAGFNDGGYIIPYQIKRIAFGSWTDNNPIVNGNSEKNTLAYYKACVDYAKENNAWLVFMLHIGQQPLEQDQILSDLIDYIKGQGIDIVTPREGFEIKANKVSIGDIEDSHLYIGKQIKSNMLTVWEPTLGRNINSPLSDFTAGRKTLIQYLSADGGGFPVSSGILETYRSDRNDVLSFQLYHASDGRVYRRRWSGGGWTNFELQNHQILPDNSVNNESGRRDFPLGISYCTIQSSVSAGFPKNRAGLLITNRIIGNAGWEWQIYRPYQTNDIYSRYSIDNNTWSEWEKLNIPPVRTVNVGDIVVPANSTVDITIPFDGVKVTDHVTATPHYGLSTSIMYNVMVLSNNNITIRLLSMRSSDFTVTSRNWNIHVINP